MYDKNGDKVKLQKQLFILTVIDSNRHIIDFFYWKPRGIVGLGTRVQIVIQVILSFDRKRIMEHVFEVFSRTTRLIHSSIMHVDIRLSMEDL
jgi:hypothetical protein